MHIMLYALQAVNDTKYESKTFIILVKAHGCIDAEGSALLAKL